MKRLPILIVVTVLALFGIFFAFNNYIYNQKQAPPSQDITSYTGTLTGKYVCLPHRDTSGPQTLECAFGMQTDSGEYYAIDWGTDSAQMMTVQTGERFTATGLITPIALLSSDHWNKYDIVGIFSIRDNVQKE